MSHAMGGMARETFTWLGVRTWEVECLLQYFPIASTLTLEHSEISVPGLSLEDESGERRLWGSGELTSLLPGEIVWWRAMPFLRGQRLLSYLPLAGRVDGLPEPVWKIERHLQALWNHKGKTRAWAACSGVPTMPVLPPGILREDRHQDETFVMQGGAGSCGATTYIGKARDLACRLASFDAVDVVVSRYRPGTVINGHVAVFAPQRVEVPWLSVQFVQPAAERNLTLPLYAGNSFAAYRELPAAITGRAEDILVHVGSLAAKAGYRGLLGADILYSPEDGQVLLLEVNARMQGSTGLLSLLESAAGQEPTVARMFRALLDAAPPSARAQAAFPQAPGTPNAQVILRKGLHDAHSSEGERLFVYGRADRERVKRYGVVERRVLFERVALNTLQ